MQTQQAKQLSLPALLARLGYQVAKTSGSKLWYRSPLRDEAQPSFCVEPGRRVAWIFSDHGANLKGNILDFVMHYQHCSLTEALCWLDQIFAQETRPVILEHQPSAPANSPIRMLRVRHLQHPALIAYLSARAIDKQLAALYLREVHYLNVAQHRFALGWQTDTGGWCLRANNFKASVRPAGITTIGRHNHCLAIFEGMFDFLAALTYYHLTMPKGQVIVLNSVNNIRLATEKILAENFRSIRLFLDNDAAGRQATQQFLALKNTIDCAGLFSPAKDFAQWLEAGARKLSFSFPQ